MSKPVFLDTNVLVYLYDRHDARRYKRAETLILHELLGQKVVISSQVVGEFCNVMLTKKGTLMNDGDLRGVLRHVFSPMVAHQPSMDFYDRAVQLFVSGSISFYDALIVQAAIDLDCETLYSEDLQDGQKFGTLTVVNPFRHPII